MKTIYTIPAPDSQNATIEVYGDPDNAWYEWRIIDGERIVQNTNSEGRQYGQAEIALRAAGASRKSNEAEHGGGDKLERHRKPHVI